MEYTIKSLFNKSLAYLEVAIISSKEKDAFLKKRGQVMNRHFIE